MEHVLTNARVVTPGETFEGSVVIFGGRITEVSRRLYPDGEDLRGTWLIPGLIDIHSDHLEREVSPRSKGNFPLELALHHTDMRAVVSGITTVLSCARFADDDEKTTRLGTDCIEGTKAVARLSGHCVARHYIQARWDTNFPHPEHLLDQMVELPGLKLVVYNESIPGQRQFRDLDALAQMHAVRRGTTQEAALQRLHDQIAERSQFNNRPDVMNKLNGSVPIGTHDDTTIEHVIEAHTHGATLSEMPTTIDAARKSRELGMLICMGAPNYQRGMSSYDNLSCKEAMVEDLVDILCSDYHFPAMLSSLLKMMEDGVAVEDATRLMTLNPAKALCIDGELGSIETGKTADLVSFDIVNGTGVVRSVWVDGTKRFVFPKEDAAEAVEMTRVA